MSRFIFKQIFDWWNELSILVIKLLGIQPEVAILFFCKGPESKYFRLWGNLVSVATTQFCLIKAATHKMCNFSYKNRWWARFVPWAVVWKTLYWIMGCGKVSSWVHQAEWVCMVSGNMENSKMQGHRLCEKRQVEEKNVSDRFCIF